MPKLPTTNQERVFAREILNPTEIKNSANGLTIKTAIINLQRILICGFAIMFISLQRNEESVGFKPADFKKILKNNPNNPNNPISHIELHVRVNRNKGYLGYLGYSQRKKVKNDGSRID